jgi:hypothetical protein
MREERQVILFDSHKRVSIFLRTCYCSGKIASTLVSKNVITNHDPAQKSVLNTLHKMNQKMFYD